MKTSVLAFGRMSPVTAGHEKLVKTVQDIAKEHGADHHIVLSKSQDSKKNPLSIEDKVKFAKHYFPEANISGSSTEHPTFMHHAKKLSDSGTKHLIMVAGGDRVQEYHDLLHKYNGKPGQHNFEKITVKSAGERDPDADDTSGMSASKLRGHAVAGEYDKFKSGLPHGDESVHREMYKAVRKGMKVESFIASFRKMIQEKQNGNRSNS
jgi:hypothetical protein